MTKILVLGANGQLGSEIRELSNCFHKFEFDFSTSATLDVTDKNLLEKQIANCKYDYLINCTAYTSVDSAENDKELCFSINSTTVKNLASYTAKQQTKVIHISTDYVFDGTSNIPYKETSSTSPLSIYGKSKLEGEQQLLAKNPNSIIIRTSWLYSKNGQNFIKTMLRLGKCKEQIDVVFDQIGSPTNAEDLAKGILDIIHLTVEKEKTFIPGIYHYSNEGVCSWYDFAVEIFDKTNISCSVNPVLSEAFPTPAPRPAYSVLDKTKIKDIYGIKIPHWRVSLKRSLLANKWIK